MEYSQKDALMYFSVYFLNVSRDSRGTDIKAANFNEARGTSRPLKTISVYQMLKIIKSIHNINSLNRKREREVTTNVV